MPKFLLNKNIQAVILDMDGVFVDSEPIQMQAFRIYLDKYDIAVSEDQLRSFVGHSVDMNFRQIEKVLPAEPHLTIADRVSERNQMYLDLLNESDFATMEGIDDLIACSQQNNVKLGLATSSPAEQVQAVFSNIHGAYAGRYDRVFHAVVCGDEVQHKKPAADIYHLICSRLEVNEANALALEDSPAGVSSAKSAGLITVGITSEYYGNKDLSEADLIVGSATEVLLNFS